MATQTTIPQVVTNFNLYDGNDQSRLLGVDSEVKLPDIQMKTTTLDGAGIAGDIEVPIPGQPQSFTLEANFAIVDSQYFAAVGNKFRTNLVLRGSIQRIDPQTAEISWSPMVVEAKGLAKQMNNGSVKKADGMGASLVVELVYYAVTFDNSDEKAIEIDKLNNIFVTNGVDQSSDIRDQI